MQLGEEWLGFIMIFSRGIVMLVVSTFYTVKT